jgi:hypothetical protein
VTVACAALVAYALLVVAALVFPRLAQFIGATILVAALLITITAARAASPPPW